MRIRSTTLVLLAAAALPAAADAAPVPGASYGGGAPPTSFTSRGIARSVQVDAHVTADGTRARVRAYMSVPCTKKTYLSQRFDASGLIDASGRVVAQARSLRYLGPGSKVTRPRGVGTATLVFDGTSASGTVRVRSAMRTRGGRRIRCAGQVPIQLRSTAADPGTPAGPSPRTAYFGNVASTWRGRSTPITFRVNRAGTRITGALFGAALGCPRVPEYLANVSPPMNIRSDGTFRRTERFTQRFSNATDRVRILLAGRFTAAGATGTVSVTQITRFRGGARVVCRSGTVGWNAVR